jgi:hypothetical protein
MAKNDTLYTRKAAGMCGFQKFFSAVMRGKRDRKMRERRT